VGRTLLSVAFDFVLDFDLVDFHTQACSSVTDNFAELHL